MNVYIYTCDININNIFYGIDNDIIYTSNDIYIYTYYIKDMNRLFILLLD